MAAESYILYEGPSCLDGSPIVVVATGFKETSKNAKTGNMIQVYIIRSDQDPSEAVKTGADAAICGSCVHRGDNGKQRSCYVLPHMGPGRVYKSYKQGIYARRTEHSELRALGEGRLIRLGAYGDPAAAPTAIWRNLTSAAKGWTGYTHQWMHESCDPELKDYCMASADFDFERMQAKSKGWRVFRVKLEGAPRMQGEASCPASAEQNHKLTCATCLACSGVGKRKGDIVINVHGAKWKTDRFAAMQPSTEEVAA